MDSSAISHSFIRIDAFVQFLTVEKFLQKFLDLGDSGGSTNENDLVDLAFLDTSVIKNLLNWFESFLEEIGAKFFELGSGNGLDRKSVV